MSLGPMMTMMGIGTLMSQPSINEAIGRVVTPVVDPVAKNILPIITDPLSKLTDPAAEFLGDILRNTSPIGILSDLISVAFDEPEPIWTPDEETADLIDNATKARIAMAMEWQLFGEKALQPWHGLEAFQSLEIQMYGQHDASEALPEPMYADALYEEDEVSKTQERNEAFIDEQSKMLVEQYSQPPPE